MLMLNVNLYAQNGVVVNGQSVVEGEQIFIYKSELKDNNFVISFSNAEHNNSVEISLDKGRSWNDMKLVDGTFVYKHRPLKDQEFVLSFLLKSEESFKTYSPNIKIKYAKSHPEDAVIQILEKMKRFYQNEQKHQFMNLFSNRYPEQIKLTDAIESDSYNYNNIRLRYRIDRKVFMPDSKSAIFDVYWQRKYNDRTTANNNDSATIAMYFVSQGESWKIAGMTNNTLFGSSSNLLVGGAGATSIKKADLIPVAGSFLQVAGFNTKVTIKNNGETAASSFKLAFYFKPAGTWILDGTETVASLASGAQVVVNHLYTAPTAGTQDVRVVVDSVSQVNETDETNNIINNSFLF